MESILTKSIIAAILTFIIFLSGVLLRKSGEPYKPTAFTLHKLSVVAVIIFIILIYIQHLKTLTFQLTGLILFILSDIFVVLAFVSGALLSVEKIATYQLQIVHRIISWITVIFIPAIWLVCH